MRNCGTHPKTWDLLRLTRCTAVRVEVGYLTNAEDRAAAGHPGVPRRRRRGHPRRREAPVPARQGRPADRHVHVRRPAALRGGEGLTVRVRRGGSSARRWRRSPSSAGAPVPPRRLPSTTSALRSSRRSRGQRGCGRTVLKPDLQQEVGRRDAARLVLVRAACRRTPRPPSRHDASGPSPRTARAPGRGRHHGTPAGPPATVISTASGLTGEVGNAAARGTAAGGA